MSEQMNGMKLGGAIVGVLCLIIIGIMLMSTFFEAGGITNDEYFDVYDPTEDQVCTLTNTPSNDIVVRYYNGASWTTISSSDYTVDGKIVTVDSAALI
jgi:hypothetical protein